MYIICMATRNDIERLFRGNYEALYVLASRLLHDEEGAKDIVHDVFSALLSVEALEDVTAAYLMRAVRNQCLNRLRDLSTRERLKNLYAMELREIEDEEWPDEDMLARMSTIIDNFPEKCRIVFDLRFKDDKSYREISEILGISEVAVYKHLRNALENLRHNLKNY